MRLIAVKKHLHIVEKTAYASNSLKSAYCEWIACTVNHLSTNTEFISKRLPYLEMY